MPHLDSGHDGSIPQTRDAVRSSLTEGLISLDANVLLSFYRFSSTARAGLIDVLEALEDRVFVTHQAAREFWRNRLAAIDARTSAADQLGAAIDKAASQLQDAVRVWAKQTAADGGTTQNMLKTLTSALESCRTAADEATNESSNYAYDIHRDAVVQALLPLLSERVGAPLEPDVHKEAVAEATRRTQAGAPPGFKDATKDHVGSLDGSSGDYLVWLQSMLEAERRELPLVLVTGDEKEDWWWKHRGQLLGPRSELVSEFNLRCGRTLVMLRPAQLIEHADVLQVTVPEAARSDVERGTQVAEGSAEWSDYAVAELLLRLDEEGREQAAVIRFAARNGGCINRDDLYTLCKYPSDRMLRGFTRPTARLTRDLQREGLLDEGVAPMLTPIYETGVLALRFELPPEVTACLSSPTNPVVETGEVSQESVRVAM